MPATAALGQADLDTPGLPRAESPHGRRPRRGVRAPVYLWIPALAVACAMALPLAYLIIRTTGAGTRALDIIVEANTLRVLANTALLAVIVTAVSTFIALPLAWLTTRTDLPGRRVWAVLVALPLVIPSYVGAFAYIAAFGPRGTLQSLLAPLGVQRLPELYGLPGAVLALTLVSYPYVLLTVRSALAGMDPALEEASRGLGHPPMATFRRVILPQLRPAIGAGGLLVALYTLSDFGAVTMMRFNAFTRAIYLSYRAAFDRTPAAVLALVLVVFTLTVVILEGWSRGRARYHRTATGASRRPPVVSLGRWRWPALALCSLVVVAALVVPVGVMVFWLLRGITAGEPLRLVGAAAWNSVVASTLAALACVAAALPVAILAVRHPSPRAALAERLSYTGYALPGIVVALSLVFFGARYGGPVYQTLGMLVLAYVVLFLPQALGAARTSLLQVPPSIEEAARGLGRSGFGVLWSVTVPLIRPGVLAGAALVFLTVMKELPATLLLSPIGFPTLATTIWSASSEAFYARAAAPALLLVLVSGVPLAVLLNRQGRISA